MSALGDLIGGRFVPPCGDPLVSRNPASGDVVLETAADSARIGEACDAAAAAAPAWARLRPEARYEHLLRFRAALAEREGALAEAISSEVGKIRGEARGEARSLVGRFEIVRAAVDGELREGPVAGHPAEKLRFHPLGVVGVIGPYNYPLHLCHAYVLPALLCGNAVVVKPSEIAPLSAQRYAEAALAAELPAGVLNIVAGRGDAGRALSLHPAVRGLCFTGSYEVGRRITEQLLDRPEVLLALEMGGKNTAVVCRDADLRQAAHEVVVGGYLTTGQRCTATDRVLVDASRIDDLIAALVPMVKSLRFGDPASPQSFAGPLATAAGKARFDAAIAAARDAGAEPVVNGEHAATSGNYTGASLHRLPAGKHHVPGYTDVETFGPDLAIEPVSGDDEAIALLEASPFGLANSVFTASTERFERYYQETRSGILNRNRSTNLASPRLPFGGVGRSGNYRPAGAHTPRNVVAAVAVQENVIGRVTVHPHLLPTMPPPQLDRLEAQHREEELVESRRDLVTSPRPRGINRPAGGELPQSDAWLTRLYSGNRVVAEKKPCVLDHLRSAGPYMVSIDDEPLSVLDGMSQTATLCGGFAEDPVVKAYVEGEFGDSLIHATDTTLGDCEAANAYATVLRHLVDGLEHVTFANSGAEANEKALALARINAERRGATRVLAFEGGFHGRTLFALSATYNPVKREPYEIAGYSAAFVPFPVWATPSREEGRAPSGFYAAAAAGDIAELQQRFGDADEDPLLAREVASLAAVDAALSTGEFFACIVEPMQSEGGDRYATARFHRALRLLTRRHQVHLIYDEVQTGFGLGGEFAWHSQFRLVNSRGKPDFPDAVTFAKRAQVGVCMSRWPDPELTASHPASLIRGRIHAEMMSTAHNAERIEALVAPRLAQIAAAFPHLVSDPRNQGYALAFDLPSPEHLAAYLGQRFWRGAVVFGAGTRTVRYRLSLGYSGREINRLFETIRRSLAWLDAHPGSKPPAWEDLPSSERPQVEPPPFRIRTVSSDEAVGLLPAILDIEYRVYEPARRTPPEEIRAAIEHADGILVVGEVQHNGEYRFVGFGIGHPLEAAAQRQLEEGPERDPMCGRDNTLYSVSITMAPEYQGLGIGRYIKEAQLRVAAGRRRADGTPRYRYVTGRNRVGHTPRMNRLNRTFGAHVVEVLTGQYEDPEGQAIYYRIPLAPVTPDRARKPATSARIDLAQGLCRPLAEPPDSLIAAEKSGLLYGPAVNKITVMNYVTPAVVRALEWVNALFPRLPHLYLTSSRDETVDKSLRILRYNRPGANVAIGFAGGYVGHTTAAARSISDPAVHRQGPPHYRWPRAAHPADVGTEASIQSIRDAVGEAGGPDNVLGLYYELVQERTGRTFPESWWPAITALRAELDLPLVAVETASAFYRSGHGAFASAGVGAVPDLMIWWGGGQTGYIHSAARLFVDTPLTMVSTWDGDEISLVREHFQLREARRLDLAPAIEALDAAMAAAAERGFATRGLGLYRVIDAGEGASELAASLDAKGLRVRTYPGGRVVIAPGLDQAEDAGVRLARALRS
jgi:acyl-CoA reductase-like NAD-dependent aldehyde dehydrogenase/4-aminobutyrate aminotransferase-like enzyme